MEFSGSLFDLMNKSELPPSTKGYYLEKSVILLFEDYLKAEDQIIYTDYKVKDGTVFDAVIPSGFKELRGPIFVEIKTSVRHSHLSMIKDSLKKLPKDINIGTLLLISGSPMSSANKRKLMYQWKEDNTILAKLVVWDIEDLERIFKNTNLSNNISFSHLKNQTEESKLSSLHKNNLERLKGIYKSGKIVLFLGSGVSKDHNLPLWNELIGGLSSEIISSLTDINYSEEKLLIKELSDLLQGNPLISASYLERGLLQGVAIEDDKQANLNLYTKLKNTLYKNYKDSILNKESQLYLIAQGIVNSCPNNGIKSVITYNYDDLLQKYLKAINNQFKVQSVFNDFPKENDSFSIYHPHGFLPYNENDYSDYRIEGQEIIFTEDSYHKLQADAYSWRNLVQINAFREDTVVMLGLSVSDPNLRRLLIHTSQRPERNHFALLQRYSGSESESLRYLRPSIFKDFLNIHHSILEENFEKLGVNVIWYDNHKDIPNLLADIFGISNQINV